MLIKINSSHSNSQGFYKQYRRKQRYLERLRYKYCNCKVISIIKEAKKVSFKLIFPKTKSSINSTEMQRDGEGGKKKRKILLKKILQVHSKQEASEGGHWFLGFKKFKMY